MLEEGGRRDNRGILEENVHGQNRCAKGFGVKKKRGDTALDREKKDNSRFGRMELSNNDSSNNGRQLQPRERRKERSPTREIQKSDSEKRRRSWCKTTNRRIGAWECRGGYRRTGAGEGEWGEKGCPR